MSIVNDLGYSTHGIATNTVETSSIDLGSSSVAGVHLHWDGVSSLDVDAYTAGHTIDVGSGVATNLALRGLAGHDAEWQALNSKLVIKTDASLALGTASNLVLSSDGTDVQMTANGDIKVDAPAKSMIIGDVAGSTDVVMHGLTPAADCTWDASQDSLILGAAANLQVTTADSLTVGGKIVPQHFDVVYHLDVVALADVNQFVYIAPYACKVVSIQYVQTAVGGTTLDLQKNTLVTMLAGVANLALGTWTGAAAPLAALTAVPADLQLAAGDHINAVFGAVGAAIVGGCLVITLERV